MQYSVSGRSSVGVTSTKFDDVDTTQRRVNFFLGRGFADIRIIDETGRLVSEGELHDAAASGD